MSSRCSSTYIPKRPQMRLRVTVRHELGYKVASIDFDYSERSMDFLKASGFALLG